MFNLKSIMIASMCVITISCARETRNENNGLEEGTTRSSSVVFTAEGGGDLAVYVFNENNESFLYHSHLDGGWTDEAGRRTLSREFPNGDYKFLFLANKCRNLALPAALTTRSGELCFEDMVITHLAESTKPGYYAGADEIFMQDDPELAAKTHTVNGNTTVSAHLTRAVGKIEVRLGRGYKNTLGAGYIPMPYTDDDNIADLFQGYEIEVTDCGNCLSLTGCTESAKVYEEYGADAARVIRASDKDNDGGLMTGFAVVDGPFILPPAADIDMQVRVRLIPAEGAGIPEYDRTFVNAPDTPVNIPRNHKLVITIWLDTLTSRLTATAEIADMDAEIPGNPGIWY